MSTEETPFKVGHTYRSDYENQTFKVIHIEPGRAYPVVTLRTEDLELFTFDKLGAPHKHHITLFPPKTLPPLPEGREWHCPDEVTQEMIDAGYRPMMRGEARQAGDEWAASRSEAWRKVEALTVITRTHLPHRTKRPLPPEKKRVPLGSEDVPPGSVFRSKEWTFTDGYWSPSKVARDGILFAESPWFSYASMKGEWEILKPGTNIWQPMWKEVDA